MAIFFLIDQVALGLYLILFALGLRYVWRFATARSEFRSTYFELERDLARQRQMNAIVGVIVAVQCAVLILGVQQSVVPFLRSEEELMGMVQAERDNIDDGEFYTATPPPLAGGGLDIEPVPPLEGDNDTVLLLTPTLTPTPVGTIVPNPPSVVGCDDDRATLQVPANGMRVFQPVVVRGTAYAEEFSSYKIEIRGPSTLNNYAPIDNKTQPVREIGDISQFVPSRYEPGAYEFRLMVFDLDDTPVASCMVTIYISDPPTTATPTPQSEEN